MIPVLIPTNQQAVKILDKAPLQPEADIADETLEADTTAAERLAEEAANSEGLVDTVRMNLAELEEHDFRSVISFYVFLFYCPICYKTD